MNFESQRKIEPIIALDFFDLSSYKIEELLGSSNSSVYGYTHVENPNLQVAVKEIRIKNLQEQSKVIENLKKLQKIKQKQHSHIIKILGFCKIVKKKLFGDDQSIALVMEQSAGNLEEWIVQHRSQKEYFSSSQIKQFLLQIVSALLFLQEDLHFSHGDIKPENIFITKDCQFKLGDLDDIRFQGRGKTQLQIVEMSTPQFQAPEIYKAIKQIKSEAKYNAYKADVYSLGLSLLYMTTFHSFSQLDRTHYYTRKQEFNDKIKSLRKEVKERYDPILSKLIKCMLEPDPFKRPDFKGLFNKFEDCQYWVEQQPNSYSKQSSLNSYSEISAQLPANRVFKPYTQNNQFAISGSAQNQQSEEQTNRTQTNSIAEDYTNIYQKESFQQNFKNVRDTINEEDMIAFKNQSHKKNFKKPPAKQSYDFKNSKTNNKSQCLTPDNSSINSPFQNTGIHYSFTLNNSIVNMENNNLNNKILEQQFFPQPLQQQYPQQQQQQLSPQSQFTKQDSFNSDLTAQLLIDEGIPENEQPNELQEIKMKYQRMKKIVLAILVFFVLLCTFLGLLYYFSSTNQMNNNNNSSNNNKPNNQCSQNQYKMANNQCVDQCPQQYWSDTSQMLCTKCDESCQTCVSGSQANNCSSCKDQQYLLIINSNSNTGICTVDCPDKYFKNQQNWLCQQCLDGCNSCQNAETCDSCDSETFMYQNKCVINCPDNYMKDIINRCCIPIPSNN